MNTNPENHITANNLEALICPNCQQKVVVTNASFCLHCGYSLRSQNDARLAYTRLLEDAIKPYQQKGFKILHQSEMSITMGLQKRMDGCLFVVLILIFFPGAILYAIMSYRTETVHFRVTSQGKVETSGYRLRTEAEKQTKQRNHSIEQRDILIAIGLLTTIFIILLGAIWLTSFFDIPFGLSLFLLFGLAAFTVILFKKEILRLVKKEE